MSRLKESLERGRFVVTGEIGPPKGTDLKKCLADTNLLKDKVTSVNVTDLQSAVMRVGSLAVSAKLVDRGVEPVFQVTCRDRNRLALQSDLLSAWTLGIQNVLCLTGDHPFLGDHPEARAVYDLDSVQLLKAAKGLNQGSDLSGHELEGKTDFYLGAVVTPGAVPVEPQVIKMRKKIAAGAAFFQTQAVYEPDKFETFIEQTRQLNVPIIAGIVLLKSAAMARFMNENVAGITVPDELINEIAETAKEDRKQKAVEIAVRIIEKVKPMCQGVHIMPLGWDELVPQVIEQAGLNGQTRA